MDAAQRTVLQNNHMELARDIVTTEDFLGICYQQKLFDTNLIEIIRSQPGIKAQTYKMLELLPTRGPEAFNKFLKMIDQEYHWLASKLKSDLEQEVAKIPQKEITMVATSMNLQTNQTNGINSKLPKDVEMVPVATTQINQSVSRSVSQTEPASPKDLTDSAIALNGFNAVKKKIGNFMTQNFSLSRKLCQSDKQQIETFITEQIREVQKQSHQKVCEVRDHRRLNDEVQRWLQDTCRKLERRVGHINPRDTMDGGFINGKSTIKDLEECIHHLAEQHHKLESEVKKCISLFGENSDNLSLAFQVESILAEKKKLKKEIKKLSQENELMVSENYDLSSAQQKLKQTNSYKDVELEVKDRQIKNLQSEKHELRKEIERLQRLHLQHLEKEKTLLNLQQMVHALKEQNNDLADASVKMQDDLKRNSPRRSQSIPKNSRPTLAKYRSPNRKKTYRN
ncbi:uncharacterized protein LOC127723434 [Mytilus californianus]|uniref:uncharacterized protein LOC127723434 n=1 Tax=Mytilus californianus TaxID=6549 RepID=UPI002247B110|nr:uncharacterized protein LOC127723434 [Mytilus californianus]